MRLPHPPSLAVITGAIVFDGAAPTGGSERAINATSVGWTFTLLDVAAERGIVFVPAKP